MQSSSGIATAAVLAVIDGEIDEHESYCQELYLRLGRRRANDLLSEEIVDAMLMCMRGNRKKVSVLYQCLVALVGQNSADRLMINAYVSEARSDFDQIHRQRLFKSLCRYVRPPLVVSAFAGLSIEIPCRIAMAVRSQEERANEHARRMVNAVAG